MSGGSVIESAGATTAGQPTDRGDVISNGNVVVNNPAQIHGNATAGPGKQVKLSGDAVVTGQMTSATTPFTCTPVDLAPLAATVAANNDNARIGLTAHGLNPLTGASHLDFKLTGADSITLTAGTYYFTTFTLTGASILHLSGATRVFCTGKIDINGGSLVNAGGSPFNLKMWSQGTAVALSNNGTTLVGFVYSPSATFSMSGGRVIGGIFAGTFKISSGGVTRAIDDVPPRVLITAPTDGAAVSDPTHVTVVGTAFDDQTIVSVKVNGVTTAVAEDGSWSTVVDLGAAIPATITAVATDSAGVTATASVSVQTAMPPTVTLTSPAPGSLVDTRMMTVSGTCGTATTVTINGTSTPCTGGTYSLAGFDLGLDGDVPLTITATNGAGSVTIAPVVSLDTAAPVMEIDTPKSSTPGLPVYLGASPISVSGPVSDSHLAKVMVGSQEAQILGNRFTVASYPLAEGRSTITAIATDTLGHPTSFSVEVVLDTAAPSVTITLPTNGQVFESSLITVEGAVDEPNLAEVRVGSVVATVTGNHFTAPNVPLVEGTNSLTAVATDTLGQPGSSQAVFVDRDTLAPEVSINGTSLVSVTDQVQIVVKGTVSDPHLTSVTVNGVPATIAGGIFTAPGVPLQEGDNSIVATAKDTLGHSSDSSSVTVNRDTLPPQLAISLPVSDAPLESRSVDVTGTVSDPHLDSVSVNGVEARVTGLTFTALGVPLIEGDASVVATAIDTLGHPSIVTVAVVVDSLSPIVTIDAPTPALVSSSNVTVTGTVNDPHLESVTVKGVPAVVSGGRWTATGVLLDEGSQELVALASDTFHHDGSSDPVSWVLDTRAPENVVMTTPLEGGLFGVSGITVAGTASDPHLASVQVGSMMATLTGDGWRIDGYPLTEGTNVLTALASDSLGHETTSGAVHVVLDSNAPAVTISGPASGAIVDSEAVRVSGTVVAGHLDGVTINGVTATVVGNAFFAEGIPLVEGANALVARATDALARMGEASVVVSRDTQPPYVTIDAPVVGAESCFDGSEAGAVQTLGGSYQEPHPSTGVGGAAAALRLEVHRAGSTSVESVIPTIDSTTKRWSATGVPLGTADGTASVAAIGTDSLGHVSRAVSSWRIDAGTPSVRITLDGQQMAGSAGGAAPAAGEEPALFNRPLTPRGTVTDGSAGILPEIVWSLDGAAWTEGTAIAAEGQHILVAHTIDCAGHEGAAHAFFAIDRTAPRLLTCEPADGATLSAGVTVLSGTSDADLASARVNGGAAVVTGNRFVLDPYVWREGANAITIELVDRAGNSATFARSFTIRTIGPSIEILESGMPLVAGGVFFRTVTPTFRSNDSAASFSATMTHAGQTGAFTSGSSLSEDGEYSLAATATDGVGHSASAATTFRIDRSVPPSVTILSPEEGATVPGPVIDVVGTANASTTVVTVNGTSATLAGGSWTAASVPLELDTLNDLVVVARDASGRTASDHRTVMVRSGGPRILILEPANGFLTNRRKIDVVGAVVGGTSFLAHGTVTVAGRSVAVDPRGGFRAADVDLAEGTNILTASGTDSQGRTGTAEVVVISDLQPPTIALTVGSSPLVEGASFAAALTVRCVVSDDRTPAPTPTVRLNGQLVAMNGPAIDLPINSAGGYLLSVVAVDGAGNEVRAERSFVLDLGGCGLADIRPSDGTAVGAPSVTVIGKSGSAATVKVRVTDPSIQPPAPVELTALVADGTFALTGVPLPVVGDNTLTFVCLDRSGQESTTTRTLRRLADGAPIVSIADPATGSTTGSRMTAVSGTVSDGTASVTLNGLAATVAPAAGGAGSWAVAAAPLVEGPNVLVARAVDGAGRLGEARAVVGVDFSSPKVQISSPGNGDLVGRGPDLAAAVTVTGLVEVASEPHLASVVVSTSQGSVTATVDEKGRFRAESVLLDGTASAAAAQTITATATDSVGHSAASTVRVSFDRTGPALSLSTPADLALFDENSGSTVAVTGEAWGAEGSQIVVNGGTLDPMRISWSAPGTDGRRRASFTAAVPIPAADGSFTLLARVDQPDGRSAHARRLLVKDGTAPTVVETSPVAGANDVDPNGLFFVLFSEPVLASSLEAGDGLHLLDASGLVVAGSYTSAGNAVAFTPAAALVGGATYHFRAGVGIRDFAGHPLAAPREVTIQVARDPAMAPPFLDAIPEVLCASKYDVTGTTSPGATVRVRDGSLTFSGISDASGHFRVPMPLSTNGYHELHAVALGRDGQSISREATALFRVDCGAPTVINATFDRGTGEITVVFSEKMDPASLVLATGANLSASLRVAEAEDVTRAPQPASLTLGQDGQELTLALDLASEAWWRTRSVRLTIAPPAADQLHNEMASSFETVFFLGGDGTGDPAGGFLSGEVYDDATGRPLAGVTVRLYPSDAALPASGGTATPIFEATSDGRGRFALTGDVAAGRYALVYERSGYSRAVRRLALEPSVGAVPFDARLTPLATASTSSLDPVVGGTIAGPSGSGLVLTAAAGAIPGTGRLSARLTTLSGQGLPELLPLGWTPIAVADLRLETVGTPVSALPEGFASSFVPQGVQLEVPVPLLGSFPTDGELFAVRYDLASGLWVSLPLPEVDRPGAKVGFTMVAPGTVALVVPDAATATRPPVLPQGAGEALGGAKAPSVTIPLAGAIDLQPSTIPPSGRATARVVAHSSDSPASPWPSGLAVQAYLDEKLVLSGGGELLESPFSTDLVLYHLPLADGEDGGHPLATVGAMDFRVSPSPKAAQVLLESGYENIRLFPFPEQLDRGQVLGASGGTVVSPDGVEVSLAEGALTERVVVRARLLGADERSAYSVAGYQLLAGIELEVGGKTLARPATVTIPAPVGSNPDAAGAPRTILAEWVGQPADDRPAFASLAARASWPGVGGSGVQKIVAAPEPGTSDLPLAGIDHGAIYLVLRADAPIGYGTGFVRAGSGVGLEGARVRSPGLGTADLSLLGGRYALPLLSGANVLLEALHPTLDEKGTATVAALAGNEVAQVDLTVRPVGPSLFAWSPTEASSPVPVGSVVTAIFSEPLDPATVGASTVRLELADSAGAPSGITIDGTISLASGNSVVVFTPRYPLPPGRRLVASFLGGVADAGGTPYAGAVPFRWTFTTSTVVVSGGQVHPERFHIRIPVNGTAELTTDDHALPGAGWLVQVELEGPVAEPSPFQDHADSNGQISGTIGAPPNFPVTLSSRIWVRVWNPADPDHVAETFRIGPFADEDRTTFVAQPTEETVFTTREGNEVTVPAGAFETATAVTVRSLDPAAVGVQLDEGFTLARYVDVDFPGTATESLRLRFPAPADAPDRGLVFVGSPMGLPWGRRLRMLDLARVVTDSSGNRFVSNRREDQPSLEGLAKKGRQTKSSECDPAQPACTTECLDPNPEICPAVHFKSCQTCELYKDVLAEFTARNSAAFVYPQSTNVGGMAGQLTNDLVDSITAVYNSIADSFVYVPPAHNWTGTYVLPVEQGKAFTVFRRDLATGWILAQMDYAPLTASPATIVNVGHLKDEKVPPPMLTDGSPFRFVQFSPPIENAPPLALALEVQATFANGKVKVTPNLAFPLAKDSEIRLFNVSCLISKTGGQSAQNCAQVVPPDVVGSGSTPWSIELDARPEDRLLLVISPGDVDASATSILRLNLDRKVAVPADGELPGFATLHDLTTNSEISVETKLEGTLLEVRPKGALARGHRFELNVVGLSSVTADDGQGGPVGYPAYGPRVFQFGTRPASQRDLNLTYANLSGDSVANDLLKFGNLLLVGTAAGNIWAVDVTAPQSPTAFAKMSPAQSAVRAFATDGHNRLFFSGLLAPSWVVRGLRLEDVRGATSERCDPANSNPSDRCFGVVTGGVKVSVAAEATAGLLGSEYITYVGSLPTGTPTEMEILTEDDSTEPEELLDFYAHHAATGASLASPDLHGIHTFDVELGGALQALPSPACSGEPETYSYQRITVDNVTTGQSWSYDWSPADHGGTGVQARRGDRLRIRRNLRTLGYLSILGSGITVVDLNRMYRNPVPMSPLAAQHSTQCGRRVAKYEGQEISNLESGCGLSGPGDPSGLSFGGIALTPAIALLGRETAIDAYTPLVHCGAVNTASPAREPAKLAAVGGLATPLASFVPEPAAPPYFRPWLRDVAVAKRIRQASAKDGTEGAKGIDLAAFTLGHAGVLVYDVSGGTLGTPLTRFYRLAGGIAAPYYRVDVDEKRKLLFAGGFPDPERDSDPSRPPRAFIDVYDLSRADTNPDLGLQKEGDHKDVRLIATLPATFDGNHVALDESGTNLLFTWGNAGKGAEAIPIDKPSFILAGVYQNPPGGEVTELDPDDVTLKPSNFFVPLGVPTAEKLGDAEGKTTPAFKVRIALPGGAAGETFQATLESLRDLPGSRGLDESWLGPATAPGGGATWPSPRITVTLRRLGKDCAAPGSCVAEDKKFASVYNLYESDEIVVLLADPRASRDSGAGHDYWATIKNQPTDAWSERSQCRRCDWPQHLEGLVSAGTQVKELLSSGPYFRVFLDPNSGAAENGMVSAFFDSVNGSTETYPRPTAVAAVAAFADEVPSPYQISLTEPAENAATWSPGEAGISVSLTSGEALLEATDFAFHGRSLAVSIDRTYRSGVLGFGPLGSAGWSANLFAHLREIQTTGEVEYHDGQGQVWRFLPKTETGPPAGYEDDPSGSYYPPVGVYLRLQRLGAGEGWRLIGKSFDSAFFDSKGRLTEQSDRHRHASRDADAKGSTLRFRYDAFGQLVAIQDDLGRRYSLDYYDEPRAGAGEENAKNFGLLKSISDFSPGKPEMGEAKCLVRPIERRTISYQYDDERRLVGALLPTVSNQDEGDPSLTYTHSKPTVRYLYDEPSLAPSALLHAPFEKLRLGGYKRPGREVARAKLAYEPTTGAAKEIRFPKQAETPTGSFSEPWIVGLVHPTAPGSEWSAKITSPWQHEVNYSLEAGRIKMITEVVEALPNDADTPSENGEVSAISLTTEFGYLVPSGATKSDGRLKWVRRPDGSKTINCYNAASPTESCLDDSSESTDRLAKTNVSRVTETFDGSSIQGTSAYQATAKTFFYPVDNLLGEMTDPIGRNVSFAVPEIGISQKLAGFAAENVWGRHSFDLFGRLRRFEGGESTPKPAPTREAGDPVPTPNPNPVVGLTFHSDATGKPDAGLLKTITRGEPAGPRVEETLGYDGAGNVACRSTLFGTWSTTRYDEWDRPIYENAGESDGRLEAVEAEKRWGYTADGLLAREVRMQKLVDASGLPQVRPVAVRYEYNDREQVTKVFETSLATEEFGMVSSGDVLTRKYFYDEFGRIASVKIDADGVDDYSDETPGEVGTRYVYDSAGRVKAETFGDLSPQRRGYDPLGRIVYKTDGDLSGGGPSIWRGRYDAWGRLYREDLPTGAVIEREFDKAGGTIRETTWDRKPSAVGAVRVAETRPHVTSFGAVDFVTELLKPATDLEPEVLRGTKRVFDSSGRLTDEYSGVPGAGTSSDLAVSRLDLHVDYEPESGRVKLVQDGGKNETESDYDLMPMAPWPMRVIRREAVPDGRPVVETARSDFKRDALGRVTYELRSDSSETFTRYDEAGKVIRVESGIGTATGYAYDGRGSLMAVSRPEGRGKTEYAYDVAGRVRFRRVEGDGTAATTEYGYQPLTGRLAWIKHPEPMDVPARALESFTYYDDGTLKQWETRQGVRVTHTYDAANRLLSRVPTLTIDPRPEGLLPLDGGDIYSYDAASRLLSARQPSNPNASVGFEGYDLGGRPSYERVGNLGDTPLPPPLFREYDTWDRPVAVSLPEGVGRRAGGAFIGYRRTYDSLDRLYNLAPNEAAQLPGLGASWAWGGTDRLYGVTSKGPLATAHRYGYVAGPGAQPDDNPDPMARWRLGTLTVGTSLGSNPLTESTRVLGGGAGPSTAPWGQFAYGYRSRDGAKLGREVKNPPDTDDVPFPSYSALFDGQGWAWALDTGLRLSRAETGGGDLGGVTEETKKKSFAQFAYEFTETGRSETIFRDSAVEATHEFGLEGRLLRRSANGFGFLYDFEGRRTEDDRFVYRWDWRGRLSVVTIKDGWPGTTPGDSQVTPREAGHEIRYEYDALGRLESRTHLGSLPVEPGAVRPFIEMRRYVWEGGGLLAEAAYSEDGLIRWRKSYVPGPSGLDDAVQLRVEVYSPPGSESPASDKLFSYMRDELGTVLGLVEERGDADPKNPPMPIRYFYTPYGEARAETGPELRSVKLDPDLASVTLPDGTTKSQDVSGSGWRGGGLRVRTSSEVALTPDARGINLESRESTGAWIPVPNSGWAIGRSPEFPNELDLLPLTGWKPGTSYRLILTAALADRIGRSFVDAPVVEWSVLAGGDGFSFERSFRIDYDSSLAAGQTAGGAFPGGQPMLFEGAWTDPTTGIAYHRARWYDPRTQSWLSEDPEGDVDSPNLYAFVGWGPHGATDPLGEERIVATGGPDVSIHEYYELNPDGSIRLNSDGSRYVRQERAKDRTKFIASSILQLSQEKLHAKPGEAVTWAIANVDWSASDKGDLAEAAGKLGVNIVYFKNADELMNYFNSKSVSSGSLSGERTNDKISSLSVYGHGVPGILSFGYQNDYEKKDPATWLSFDFNARVARKLSRGAFDEGSTINLLTCNPATDTAPGEGSIARELSRATGATVSGYEGKIDYAGIYGKGKARFVPFKVSVRPPGAGSKDPDPNNLLKKRERSIWMTCEGGACVPAKRK
jgi:RHS repeat-associated protein